MRTAVCFFAVALLVSASPSRAGPCAGSIVSLQHDVDRAIEQGLGSDGWRPESVGALRGQQPTPRSLAASEGTRGSRYIEVLALLDQARAADAAGEAATCNLDLSNARAMLR